MFKLQMFKLQVFNRHFATHTYRQCLLRHRPVLPLEANLIPERSRWSLSSRQLFSTLILLGIVSTGDEVRAQVVSDTTLPVGERSQISAGPLFQINGGAVRDRNLFHSFAQFSLIQGETAFFNNAANITNIISRVTGGLPSRIDGVLQANGSANLFLINPGGVLFGPNAALNIGGTFLATTASALQFWQPGLL